MTFLDQLRADHERLIAENPVAITIHRVEYVDDGAGGRVKMEADLPAFTGRLMPSRQNTVEASSEAGSVTTAAWILLSPWDADLRAGSDVEDTFTANGRRYRISRVIPRRWQGEVYGLQALLEEVS